VRVWVALVAGGLLLLGTLVAVLASSADGLSGSNRLTSQVFVATTQPGEALCQSETVPVPTGAVRMTIATFGAPTPALETTVSDGGRVLGRGVLRAGWKEGVVELPLSVRATEAAERLLCVRAAPGSQARLTFGGERVAPFADAGGRAQEGRVAVVYLLAGDASWASAAGNVIDRFGYGRADLFGGHWALWVALALVVAAAGLAVRALLRAGEALR